MKRKHLVGILKFLLVAAVSSSLLAAGKSPLSLIQSGTDRALQIIRSAQSGSGPSLRERRAEILTIVDEYFDFREMAKRALGKPWKDQPPAKQEEFVKLFKQLLFNNYVVRVENYTGTNENVVYDEEKIEGEYALVKTRVLGYRNADVQLNYRLRFQNGEWRVYDVVVEGVSLIENYRGQFNSILTNKSFDALLEQLAQKVAEQQGSV